MISQAARFEAIGLPVPPCPLLWQGSWRNQQPLGHNFPTFPRPAAVLAQLVRAHHGLLQVEGFVLSAPTRGGEAGAGRRKWLTEAAGSKLSQCDPTQELDPLGKQH